MAAFRHGHVPTSSVSQVPPSQMPVSATVLEFRCLFTHDLLKKQKKWHDGALRYHTFNKRVMVYDDAKNFVGDLHYRLPEEFGEGLELKLDRPVLVQVEDQLGESSTDLTSLLTRQKPDGHQIVPVTNPQTIRSNIARISASTSQIKPKSIKELLAGSQAKPTPPKFAHQSPFDRRRALEEISTNPIPVESEQPPVKQRRLNPRDQHGPVPSSTITETECPVNQQAHSSRPVASRPVASPITCPRHAEVRREVMNISSDEEPIAVQPGPRTNVLPGFSVIDSTRPTVATATDKRTREKKNTKKKKLDAAATNLPNNTNVTIPSQGPTIGHERSPKAVSRRPKSTIPSTASSSSLTTLAAPAASSSRYSALGHRSSLRFSSQKPRPKIMYKALLADSVRHKHDMDMDIIQPNPLSNPVPRNSLLEIDNVFAASQIRSDQALPSQDSFPTPKHGDLVSTCLRPAPTHESPLCRPVGLREASTEPDNDTVPDSPLFMPRTASQPFPSPTQLPRMLEVDRESCLAKGLSPSQMLSGNAGSMAAQAAVVAQETDVQALGFDMASSSPILPATRPSEHEQPGSLLARQATPTSPPLNKLRLSLLDPSSAPLESTSLAPLRQDRLFRRVVSESLPISRSELEEEFGGSEDDCFSEPDLIRPARSNQDSIEHSRASPVFKLPVSRWPTCSNQSNESEPAMLKVAVEPQITAGTRDVEQVEAPLKQISVLESGPWTIKESFLLFDRWPPGKQKPDYGQDQNRAKRKPTESSSVILSTHGMTKKYGTFGSAKFVSQR